MATAISTLRIWFDLLNIQVSSVTMNSTENSTLHLDTQYFAYFIAEFSKRSFTKSLFVSNTKVLKKRYWSLTYCSIMFLGKGMYSSDTWIAPPVYDFGRNQSDA